jgi:uncharacterized protein YodC (DUF2158 family)
MTINDPRATTNVGDTSHIAWKEEDFLGQTDAVERRAPFYPADPFTVGDKVHLKSGGPNVMIDETHSDFSGQLVSVVVVWFLDGKVYRETLSPQVLEKSPP